jgi:hypothetical protein
MTRDPRAFATAKEVLERSRVDVAAMIEAGMPEREFVPGAHGLLPKGKRVHIAAARKTGKSLAVGVVTAVEIVAAGGTVVVLDRENGPDEFARRLTDVLTARDADAALRELVRDRLHYHAWPALDLAWRDDPAYPAAFAGVDVVIFDSTRSHLTPLGLKEDASDDFATFSAALVDPLMQAGTTTVTLDNVGHSEKDRARGTSAKEDLVDLVYAMTVLAPFSSKRAGRLEMRCVASRFGDVDGTWQMSLGAGHYGRWQAIGARPPAVRGELRDAVVEVLVAAGTPLGYNRIGEAIRKRPGNTLRFGAKSLRTALDAWAEDSASGLCRNPSGDGFTACVGSPRHGTHVADPETRLVTAVADTVETPVPTGDAPVSDSPDTEQRGDHVAGSLPYRGDTAGTPTQDGGRNRRTDTQLQAFADGELDLSAGAGGAV